VSDLDGALLQQPEMSHDGNFIAITLRGGKRETGSGASQQDLVPRRGSVVRFNWMPDRSVVYWVNPDRQRRERGVQMPVRDGKPTKGFPMTSSASWTFPDVARTSTFQSCP